MSVLVLGVIVFTPLSDARIRVQQSVAGIRIGMTPEAVKDRLGRPGSTKRVSTVFGPGIAYRYRAARLIVTLFGSPARVVTVQTTSREERTPTGVGVGSSLAAVRRGLNGESCSGRPVSVCTVGLGEPIQMLFTFGDCGVASVRLVQAATRA